MAENGKDGLPFGPRPRHDFAVASGKLVVVGFAGFGIGEDGLERLERRIEDQYESVRSGGQIRGHEEPKLPNAYPVSPVHRVWSAARQHFPLQHVVRKAFLLLREELLALGIVDLDVPTGVTGCLQLERRESRGAVTRRRGQLIASTGVFALGRPAELQSSEQRMVRKVLQKRSAVLSRLRARQGAPPGVH
eukprot:scaffold1384_cov256-Pinguiococcus_pyrenoidosus.AAC.19